MSYSFQVRGSTKLEAIDKLMAEMAKVVEAQPVHVADQAQAIAAAERFVGLLADGVDCDVCVSVNGSVIVADGRLTNSSVGVSAWFVARD